MRCVKATFLVDAHFSAPQDGNGRLVDTVDTVMWDCDNYLYIEDIKYNFKRGEQVSIECEAHIRDQGQRAINL